MQSCWRTITTPLVIINALDVFPNNVAKSSTDRALESSQMQTGCLAQKLKLKVGAKLMITANIDTPEKLSNGRIGIVYYIKLENARNVTKVYVKFDDERIGKKQMDSDRFAKQQKCIPIERYSTDIRICKNKVSSPVIKRTQFPLMMTSVCTVFKVQGNQFMQRVVSFELNKQRRFNPGQVRVALSRVTSLNSLFLIGSYDSNSIKADLRAAEEYNRLRQGCAMLPVKSLEPCTSQNLFVTLLNSHSLKRYCTDIVADSHIIKSDVICITETQLNDGQDTTQIKQMFDDFNII